ncbi:MAG: Hpt domain-containing protein [Candidatus Omnitrophica bacterium]|nr:Hpt domain-containing protein [Candidatus Omnitrophota bacterium]
MDQEHKKKAMEILGIDEEIFNELLQCFLIEAQEEIDKLDGAIATDNFLVISQIGHGLKGMAGNLYMTHMQDLAKTLETLAKEAKDKQAIIQKAEELKLAMKELQ